LHEHLCKEDVDLKQAAHLFSYGIAFVILLVVAACIKAKMHFVVKVPRTILPVLALSGGYCTERSSRWLMIYLFNDTELAYVASAFFLTMITMLLVVVMSRSITERDTNAAREEKTARACAMEELLESAAVSVGLAWDHAFMVCQTVLVDHYHEAYQLNRVCSNVVMSILLCACVLSGWMTYILPASHKTLEDHKKRHTVFPGGHFATE